MNKACLLKLVWKLKNWENSMWCQLMKMKYDIDNNQVCGRILLSYGML